MNVSNFISSLLVRFTVTGLALSAIFVLGACTPHTNGGTRPGDPTTGTLSVSLGFGAGSSSGSFCTGTGTVTIRPSTGGDQTKGYSYSGISGSSSPSCTTGLTFGNLPPGPVQISDSNGASCAKVITAGQFTSVTIRTDARTCQ
jgi:hypothetical protein